jgi:hypothetical protein
VNEVKDYLIYVSVSIIVFVLIVKVILFFYNINWKLVIKKIFVQFILKEIKLFIEVIMKKYEGKVAF